MFAAVGCAVLIGVPLGLLRCLSAPRSAPLRVSHLGGSPPSHSLTVFVARLVAVLLRRACTCLCAPPRADALRRMWRDADVGARVGELTDATAFEPAAALAGLSAATFPLVLDLMTDPGWPFPLFGSVHMRSAVDAVLPDLTAPSLAHCDVDAAWAGGQRAHRRGAEVDIVVTVTQSAGGLELWRATHTLLFLSGRAAGGAAGPPTAAPPAEGVVDRQRLSLPRGLESAWTRVSGDVNPIHVCVPPCERPCVCTARV